MFWFSKRMPCQCYCVPLILLHCFFCGNRKAFKTQLLQSSTAHMATRFEPLNSKQLHQAFTRTKDTFGFLLSFLVFCQNMFTDTAQCSLTMYALPTQQFLHHHHSYFFFRHKTDQNFLNLGVGAFFCMSFHIIDVLPGCEDTLASCHSCYD